MVKNPKIRNRQAEIEAKCPYKKSIGQNMEFMVEYSEPSPVGEGFTPGGGALCIIWVLGMCRPERYRFSRFWYKERCQFLRFGCFGIRNGVDFHDFGIKNGVSFYDLGVMV